MFLFSIGLYTLIVVIIWGFFMVIRIHALKFENFQSSIRKIVRVVTVILLILTILGYFTIFSINSSKNTSVVRDFSNTDKATIKKSLDDIGSNYY